MTKKKSISRVAGKSLWAALAAAALGALIVSCVCVPPGDVAADKTHAAAAPSAAAAGAAAPPATASATPAPAAAPPPPPPPPLVDFDQAVANAAHAVFTNAPAPDASPALIVIDPLVDGMTGYQSKATQSIQDRIVRVVKSEFPQYAVQRITPESLRQQPRILVGTFTPVNAQMKTAGQREAYRFCLVMGDLKTGKIVAKSVARARPESVDATPTAAFAESPVWTTDPSVGAYIATCQASKVGDPIKPEYFDGLLAAALVSEAGDAYDAGRYADALELYITASKTSAGDQLRVYNGLYLSQAKLGHADQAAAAFRDLVQYGLRKKRLAVKFLFQPGSVRFVADTKLSNTYGLWLEQIAVVTSSTQTCLQITGHTSATGPSALNDSLSLMRAEYIQSRLEVDEPALKKRTVAAGVGSRENLVGTGRDDASDMLDRRVELNPIEPCA